MNAEARPTESEGMSTRRLFAVGLIAALLVAVVVAQFASSEPDGLEFVAEQEGFLDSAKASSLSGAPLEGYGENLTDSDWLNTAIAGFLGTVTTLALGYGVFWLAKRGNRDRPSAGSA